MRRFPIIAVLMFALSTQALAHREDKIADVYLAPEKFLAEAFGGDVPDPRRIWFTNAHKDEISQVLGRDFRDLRIMFWRRGERTAWILEEIGEAKPITAGFVVDDGALARVAVLIYRERHGWEVRRDSFIGQFKGARLTKGYELDRRIEGVPGAKSSARALTRSAQLALYLHAAVAEQREN